MQVVNVADEIISLLASDPNAILKVSIEINADFPEGASDQIKRATSGNAKSLGRVLFGGYGKPSPSRVLVDARLNCGKSGRTLNRLERLLDLPRGFQNVISRVI